MQVYCPQCGQEIDADDLSLDTLVARCRACNAVFDFSDAVNRDVRESANADERRAAVSRPENVQIDDLGDELRFTWRWFSPQYIVLGIFALFWNGLMLVGFLMVSAMMRSDGAPTVDSDAPAALSCVFCLPLVHVIVGVVLLYTAVAGLVNRTIVSVTPEELRIRHTPLPWPGARRLRVSTLAQLYVCERSYSSRRRTQVRYSLNVITNNAVKYTLLSHLQEPELALFLERQIEDRLRIRDYRVAGEFK